MTAFAMGAIAASTAKSIPIFNFIPVFYIGLRRTPDGFIRDSGIDLFAINCIQSTNERRRRAMFIVAAAYDVVSSVGSGM